MAVGRPVEDPWWSAVTAETEIALYNGVKTGRLLSRYVKEADT